MAILSGLILALAVLGLIILANFGVGRPKVAAIALAVAAIFCALVTLDGLLDAFVATTSVARADRSGLVRVGTGFAITGFGAALALVAGVRSRLARALPIDPASPVHAVALVLTVLLVGTQLSAQLASDLLAQQATSGSPLGPLDLIAEEVPFLVGAFFGVGLFIRRPLAASLNRLGLVRPAWWHVVLALAVAGVFYAFSNGADLLGQRFTPDLAHKVNAANQRLFGQLANPVGIATIALAAGICEEVLFRGALVPRLGIVWTSLVFAAVHTQYGLSFDTAAVLVLAIALGLLRRYTNTTTTILCHVAYNALVGIGIAAAWLGPALGLEAVLLMVLVAVLTRHVGTSRATV
jgi:membrane protease YdiL (CAAX protease family)